MGAPAKKDAFPPTRTDYIDDELNRGTSGRQNVNRHIMEVYAWPLKVYFLGTKDRWLGEPEEIVQGFFASRLEMPNFFADWKRNGMKLRHWLINGFCFYLKEEHRRRSRHPRPGSEAPEPYYEDERAIEKMDLQCIVAFVRSALEMAEKICMDQDLATHWRIFHAHYYGGRPYASIASEFGVHPTRAAVMARTARRKFIHALRELFRRDGVAEESIDAEIRNLLRQAGIDLREEEQGENEE
ncbi:MAG: hypothetical protein JSR77_03950 [Planctomycetes bacterium]|nr:hypothetical protein [Planctomycetota bacterium]